MFHRTVGNMTASTKKTSPALVKYVAMHVCKETGSVSVKEERTTRRMCVCACKQVWVKVYVRHLHSPVDSYLCVYVHKCMLTPLNKCNYIRQLFYC